MVNESMMIIGIEYKTDSNLIVDEFEIWRSIPKRECT
jgi:hypothetical protein